MAYYLNEAAQHRPIFKSYLLSTARRLALDFEPRPLAYRVTEFFLQVSNPFIIMVSMS